MPPGTQEDADAVTQAEQTTTGRGAAHRRYFQVSALFAVVAAVLLVFNALQLVWPDLGKGAAFLTYGRLRPMALNAVVFGWLSIGLLGVGMFIVPKLTGADLWSPRAALGALALTAVSVAGGIVAVAAGAGQGDVLFELPLVADIGVAIGLAVAALVLVRTAVASDESDQPALWFSVAGAVWLALGFVAASAPGLNGVNAALQNAFGITAVVTLALVSMALSAAYFVAGELRGSHRGTRVAWLGFWSLAFIAAWTAPRLLVFGPGPDWLETIAVVFSFMLLIPVGALVADLASWLRGVAERRLLTAGGLFLAVFAVLNLVMSFRSPSSMVRFTGWEDAVLMLPLLGTAGCWLMAAVARINSRRPRFEGAALVTGVSVVAFAELAAGLQQGIAWVGGVNAGEPVSSGDLFVSAATAWYVIAAVGAAFIGVGLVRHGVAAYEKSAEPSAALALEFVPDDEEPEPAEPIASSVLVRGAVALFALAAVSVFLIPTLDAPARTATIAADAIEFADGSLQAEGQDLYVSEGCVYCHTQQVRSIITDVGLGAVSLAGDYARQSPDLLGTRRIGPDLTHIGERTTSTRSLIERLRSPRQSFDGGEADGWAIMPSYDYLSDDDLLAIAEYLGALN